MIVMIGLFAVVKHADVSCMARLDGLWRLVPKSQQLLQGLSALWKISLRVLGKTELRILTAKLCLVSALELANADCCIQWE